MDYFKRVYEDTSIFQASLNCKLCSKSFTKTSSRKRHEVYVHSTATPCRYCGKKLKMKRKDALLRHLSKCSSSFENK